MDGNPDRGRMPRTFLHRGLLRVAVLHSARARGHYTAVTQPIHVEITNPTVAGAPTRGPDSNGWYNHPVTIAFSGSSFSGIASCTSAIYSGPSTPSATRQRQLHR